MCQRRTFGQPQHRAIEPYCAAEAFIPILSEICVAGYFGASCGADKRHRPVLKCRVGQQLGHFGCQRPQCAGVARIIDGEVMGEQAALLCQLVNNDTTASWSPDTTVEDGPLTAEISSQPGASSISIPGFVESDAEDSHRVSTRQSVDGRDAGPHQSDRVGQRDLLGNIGRGDFTEAVPDGDGGRTPHDRHC